MDPARPTAVAAPAAGTPDLHGVRPQAVIAAIQQRARHWRERPGAPDGRQLALVIEGGAMRAACSAGGAVALAQLGFSDLFDEVFATSAGVMNASYFLSNQPLLGISVYFDCCTTRRFVNPLRLWKVLNVDYIFDEVVTVAKPLAVDRIRQSRTRLLVAVLDRLSGTGRLLDARTTSAPLLRVLKAATAMPVFYNRTVTIEGRPCMDGGLAIPFPLEHAIARGATDVLVLLTRPAQYRSGPRPWWSRWLFNLICAHGHAALNRTFACSHEVAQRARDLAFGRSAPPAGVNIATLALENCEHVGERTVDRAALHAGAEDYGRKVMRVFGRDPQQWSLPPLAS